MSHGPIQRDTIFAKLETTYGTDPTPTGSNAILVRSIQHGFDRLRMVPRPVLTGALGQEPQVYAGSLEAITIECELKGSGQAGTAPEFGPLLRACGLAETVVASTSVTYAPQSGSIESCTIYYYKAVDNSSIRVRHILTGCRGNVQIVANTGDYPILRFMMVGRRATPTDQSALSPTYDATTPLALRGLTVSLGSVQGVVQSFELDVGHTIDVPDNMNNSEGYGEITIIDRDPVLTLTRHDERIATINPWGDLSGGTARAFDTGTVGSSAGNRWRLQASKCYYRNLESGEANGMRTIQSVFGCHASTVGGSDHFTLAFT
jgi:hypothetical protein